MNGARELLQAARTVADLACATTVLRPHVAEALSFRHRMSSRAEA